MIKYLIHWNTTCSGGLCDRILGMASNLCIAKILNRKFLVKWDNTDTSNGFTINNKYDYYNYNLSYRQFNLNNFEMKDYFKDINIVEDWRDDNILLWSNINLYYYLLENKYFRSYKMEDYIKNFSDAIKEVLFEVFDIKDDLLDEIKNLPVYDIGIHIRNGDKQFKDIKNEILYSDYIKNILNNIKKHIKDNANIFISSDCNITYTLATKYFANFNYNKGVIIHTNSETNSKLEKEGLYKVFLDLITLCNCTDTLYIGWNSNFSRIASLYNPSRKIICFEYENKQDEIKEITNDILFSYFSWGKYN